MEGNGKGGTRNLSFQKGYLNDLYINGLVKSNIIIEANNTLQPDKVEEKSGYAYKDKITRTQVESGEIQLRIWRRKGQEAMGEAALHLHDVWEIVFDKCPNKDTKI
jgi:hypothetical protein